VVYFTLYSRSYCHLCDDLLDALHKLHDEFSFEVNVVDVDADQDLLAKYDVLVPVLVGGKGSDAVELCHYFLDEKKVRAFLFANGQ
jgi:thiol-disulfide isomerase/thioredoxin